MLESKDRNVNTFPRSSSPKPPQIPPRMNDIIIKPMTSVGIRTSPKHFQKHNSTASAIPSTYSSGNLGGKTAEAAVVRSTAGRTGNKRAKAHNRSWSPSRLRKVEASKANKEVKNEEEKEVKNSGKVIIIIIIIIIIIDRFYIALFTPEGCLKALPTSLPLFNGP